MSTAAILKIEYKRDGEENFTEISIQPNSAFMKQEFENTKSGGLYNLTSQFDVVALSTQNEDILKSLAGYPSTYRLTGTDGNIYTIGTSSLPIYLKYNSLLDAQPSGANKYRCFLYWKSTAGYIIS